VNNMLGLIDADRVAYRHTAMTRKNSAMAAMRRSELYFRADDFSDDLCSRKKWMPAGNRTR
jgi:hypothetical protein